MIEGSSIYLRPIQAEDDLLLFQWENDPKNQISSTTDGPYSLDFIQAFIESLEDVSEACQLKMMIVMKDSETIIGSVDLTSIDFKNRHAEVGILIADVLFRGKGYAKESLLLLMEYVRNELKIHNLVASIMEDNEKSIHLFESVGFQLVGTKKEWFNTADGWKDEKIYQICLKERRS